MSTYKTQPPVPDDPVRNRYAGRAALCVAGVLLALGALFGRRAATVHAGSSVCQPAITVTSRADAGSGSLRQAIADLCHGGQITFDAALDGQTIDLTSGQLVIAKTATLHSAYAVAISAGIRSRVLQIIGPATVTITHLTLQDGVATAGGGILNSGDLRLITSTVRNNLVDNGVGGGGIFNQPGARLLIRRSTLSGNMAGHFGSGGGLYNNQGHVTIENSTLSGNVAGGGRFGGAVSNHNTSLATVTIINSTLTANSAGSPDNRGAGGGIHTADSAVNPTVLVNTIVAGNYGHPLGVRIADDILNQPLSAGHNLIGVGDGYDWQPSDLTGTLAAPRDPALAGLRNNGGPTRTHMPLAHSAVIDAGSNAAAVPPVDQRGFPRIHDGGTRAPRVDIGALEYTEPVSVTLSGARARGGVAAGVWLALALAGVATRVATTSVRRSD